MGLGCSGKMFTGLGPVVQSVVSLTSSLRVISLTVLADSIYNILIFFALQKLLTFFFSKKLQHIRVSLDVNFNESLTNDVVSFEQLGPGVFVSSVTRACPFIHVFTKRIIAVTQVLAFAQKFLYETPQSCLPLRFILMYS